MWVGLGIAFFLQSLQQFVQLLVLQAVGAFRLWLVLLFLIVILELKLLRRLSKDVLIHLLHDLLRNFLQLAIQFVHILPEVLLHHPLQPPHSLLGLSSFLSGLNRSGVLSGGVFDVFEVMLLIEFEFLLDEHG